MNDGSLYFSKKDDMVAHVITSNISRDDTEYNHTQGKSDTNEESLRPLLNLLEKAEQILSILNLSDNTIRKYNQLKQLTYEKLDLEYSPLIRNYTVVNTKKDFKEFNANYEDNNTNQDNFWNIISKERNLNHKKNRIIEFLCELIEKFVFEINSCSVINKGSSNINYFKKFLIDKENHFNKQFEKLISNEGGIESNHNSNFSKNLEDLEFEMKIEEIKIQEYLNKSEMNYKKFISNLNLKFSLPNGKYSNEDQNNLMIINELENKIENLKKIQQIEKKEFIQQFNELRLKYNPELEKEFFQLKTELDHSRHILDKINEIVFPIYEKYYNKNSPWYQKEKIEYKYKKLEHIHFVISLTNKFFNDNKYLIELVSNLEKEKSILIGERNMPFVANAIEKNGLLLEISEDYKIVEDNSNKLYNNFNELMEYININFENI